MTFRVEVSDQAERDSDAILDWLLSHEAGEAGIAGSRHCRCNSISCTISKRCGLAPEDKVFPFEVRQLLYGQKPHIYRILFTIEGDTVYVLHIRHGRRQSLRH
jgi:plasmid stabilization system protein ParE